MSPVWHETLKELSEEKLMELLEAVYNEFERREMTLHFDCAECGKYV
jgi:hypothetical protein